jgi:hypothetical protein
VRPLLIAALATAFAVVGSASLLGYPLARTASTPAFGIDYDSFRGTILAVAECAGTITATVRPRSAGSSACDPYGARMTFTTDPDTAIFRDGAGASLADLRAGDRVEVLVLPEGGAGRALAQPAFVVSAHAEIA